VLRQGYMRRRCERGATGGMPPGVLARTWAGYYATLYSSGHMTFFRDEKQVRVPLCSGARAAAVLIRRPRAARAGRR
jgi:hypothetical protein